MEGVASVGGGSRKAAATVGALCCPGLSEQDAEVRLPLALVGSPVCLWGPMGQWVDVHCGLLDAKGVRSVGGDTSRSTEAATQLAMADIAVAAPAAAGGMAVGVAA